MKKIVGFACAFFMVAGLFASPLSKALDKGKWKVVSKKTEESKWTKNDVSMIKVSADGNYTVTLKDSQEQIIFEADDSESLEQIVAKLLKNDDPNVEWNEVKDGKLSGRKLKKRSITKADAEDSATGKREGVSTASSRASAAKEDYEWSE